MKSVTLKKDWGRFEKGSELKVDDVRAEALAKDTGTKELSSKKTEKKIRDGKKSGI